jgi:hypothetical protein
MATFFATLLLFPLLKAAVPVILYVLFLDWMMKSSNTRN